MKRLTILTIIAITLITSKEINANQSKYCAQGNSVKFASATWESAAFYTDLARALTILGYGCKTEVITGSKSVTEAALVVGDLDIWMEQWEGQNAITKDAEKKGKVKLIGDLLKGGTLEGWFVPDYIVNGDKERGIKAVAPDLNSVGDLVKYKHLFTDLEERNKGRFLNCPTGWECEKTNSQKLKAYNLTNDYTNFHPGTGGALDAEITSAVNRGKPILFYYWSPSSILGKFKFNQLKEPQFNEKCWATLFNNKTDDACGSSSPSAKLVVGVAIDFYNNAPDLVKFLDKIQLPADILNSIIADIGDKKISTSDAVERFIRENHDIWKSWVNKDAEAHILEHL